MEAVFSVALLCCCTYKQGPLWIQCSPMLDTLFYPPSEVLLSICLLVCMFMTIYMFKIYFKHKVTGSYPLRQSCKQQVEYWVTTLLIECLSGREGTKKIQQLIRRLIDTDKKSVQFLFFDLLAGLCFSKFNWGCLTLQVREKWESSVKGRKLNKSITTKIQFVKTSLTCCQSRLWQNKFGGVLCWLQRIDTLLLYMFFETVHPDTIFTSYPAGAGRALLGEL